MKDLKEKATSIALALIILIIVGIALLDTNEPSGDLNGTQFYGILAIICVAGLIGYKDKRR